VTAQVVLLAAAEADLAAAVAWYDRQAPGLGDSFIGQVEAVFDQLRRRPEMYQVAFAAVRRAVLQRFPFAVIYHVRLTSIEVLGVLPCRADPKLLMQRVATIGNQ